ncbi:MAG: NTP transferase domain-containing protein [Desulfobacteraceae bacterium]|nr:NTP transferase domain-containing protein [Desulfobacteraceae bacterium]
MKYADIAAVILAAGKGTRMKSDLPKVLHKINSKSLINYVAECAVKVVGDNIHVVVGHQAEKVKNEIKKHFNAVYTFQKNMLGTGDAVKVALAGLPDRIKNVLVLNGDVPFIKEKTLLRLINTHKEKQNSVTLLTVEIDDPTGYGRIIQNNNGNVICIKEEADASIKEKKIRKINSGIYCFDREFLEYAIPKIESDNVQEEYYLTDVIKIAIDNNKKIDLMPADDWREVVGINTLAELNKAKILLKEIGL